MRTKVVVLVVVIIAVVLTAWSLGPVPAVSLILGAGMAGAQVARVLVTGGASTRPGNQSRIARP
jgi:hypothetical protein